jgi:hypothetical protein
MILAPALIETDEPSQLSVKQVASPETDQLMLRRGELDVEGMGRLLNGMANAAASLRMGSPIKRTRVFD